MSVHENSLLDLFHLSLEKIEDLFSKAKKLKTTPHSIDFKGDRVALLFFEPSTRTRMSFESAAIRCGLAPMIFDGGPGTSLEKGETVEDSILNIAAMLPKALIIRSGDDVDLKNIAAKVQLPVINAGWGVKGHPTQALLDTFTIQENFFRTSGVKVLIIGDVKHSRVASSHFQILPRLGCQVGICGPKQFLSDQPGVTVFNNLNDALEWADVAMVLRVQFERHTDKNDSVQEYKAKFSLNFKSMKSLRSDAIIMHPGPINHGIEMETEVLSDPRCKVLQQVTNGVFIREAILRECLHET